MHENYEAGKAGDHDIALLQLKKKNEIYLPTYTPACLPKQSDRDSFDNKRATAAGWGIIHQSDDLESNTYPEVPYHIVDMTVLNWKECPGMKGELNHPVEKSPSDICIRHQPSYPDFVGTCKVSFYSTYNAQLCVFQTLLNSKFYFCGIFLICRYIYRATAEVQ